VSVSSNQKLPAVAQEVLAALNGGDKEDPGVYQFNYICLQV